MLIFFLKFILTINQHFSVNTHKSAKNQLNKNLSVFYLTKISWFYIYLKSFHWFQVRLCVWHNRPNQPFFFVSFAYYIWQKSANIRWPAQDPAIPHPDWAAGVSRSACGQRRRGIGRACPAPPPALPPSSSRPLSPRPWWWWYRPPRRSTRPHYRPRSRTTPDTSWTAANPTAEKKKRILIDAKVKRKSIRK